MAKLIKCPTVFALLLLAASNLYHPCGGGGGHPPDEVDGQKKMIVMDGWKPVGMKIFIPPCIRSGCKDGSTSALTSYETQKHRCWCCLTISSRPCFPVKTDCWAACPRPRPPSSHAPQR